MAGQGARFGHRFKPFLTVSGSTFIEAAVAPFRDFASEIERLVFVYLDAQERDFSVRSKLLEYFPDIPFETVHLANPTRGPAETISAAVKMIGASGPAMICDCDHSLDVAPLFDDFRKQDAEAVIPVWPLNPDEIKSWSVARVDSGIVRSIAEKSVPEHGAGVPMGVIGCYGFKAIESVAARADNLRATNFSDVIQQMLEEQLPVRAATITRATFFGDPERLARAELSA